MYEAKSTILLILKLNEERVQMIEYVNIRIRISDQKSLESREKAKTSIEKINKLAKRITS